MSVLSGIGGDSVFAAGAQSGASRSQLASAALARGAKLMRDGQYREAIPEFQRAIGFQPDSSVAQRYIGRAHALLGEKEQAVNAYRRGVSVAPDSLEARLDLARIHQQYGQLEQAEQQYLAVQRRDPGSISVTASLGYMYLGQGRFAEAETQFQRLVRLSPQDPSARRAIGQLRNEQGRHAEAVVELQRALTLDPRDAGALSDLGRAHFALGDRDRAETVVEDLIRLDTDQASALAYTLQLEMFTPEIAYLDSARSTFRSTLGPGTPLATLDPKLSEPGESHRFEMVFTFNQPMDAASVQNQFQWSITRAAGGETGLYNNGITRDPSREVSIKPIPFAVRYDPATNRAHVYFDVRQNDAGTGVMDPSHWVFRFSGTDAAGNPMDPRGDQYSGSVGGSF